MSQAAYGIINSLGQNIIVGTGGLYSQTSNSTPVANTITETSLINSAMGVGNLSVPAFGFSVGDSFHAKLIGLISSANNQTIDIRIKSDSVVLANTGLVSIATSTNRKWEINIYFTIRNIGRAGVASIVSGGMFSYVKNASTSFEGADFSLVNNTTFDTTISNTLDITLQWGAANPSNSIFTQLFVLQKIY